MKKSKITIREFWNRIRNWFYQLRKTEVQPPVNRAAYRQEACAGKELLDQVEDFLNQTYELRFNLLTDMTEFRMRDQHQSVFRPVSLRELNSFCIAARRKGIDCWDRDIARYVNSGEISLYHPLHSFMDHLPVWDGIDRVEALARRVSGLPVWVNGFHRWMRGMVAQWMEWDGVYGNSVAPVLVSREQGKHKSTFCRMLIPTELQSYYTDSFDLNGANSAEHKLAAFGLINLDELDKFSERKMTLLKNLMQMAGVNLRKAHKRNFSKLPRMASFIATSNRKDLLTDPTGSRRFLCVEITDIIDNSPIDHAQLYAQLKAEVTGGEKYWFTSEEEKVIRRQNAGFQRRSMAEDVFRMYFQRPQLGEKGELLSAAEIFSILKKKRPAAMRDTTCMAFGKILIAMGIERKHTREGNFYHIIKKTP